MNKNFWLGAFFGALMILGVFGAVSCSQRTQVRLEGFADLGELPSDMVYDESGMPLAHVSSESDGDLILSYVSDKGALVAQLYGCPIISMSCPELGKYGAYFWDIPNMEPSAKYVLAPEGYIPPEEGLEEYILESEIALYTQAAANKTLAVSFQPYYVYDVIIGNYVFQEGKYAVVTDVDSYWALVDEVCRLTNCDGRAGYPAYYP